MREIKFRGKTKMAMVDLDILEIPHVNGWVYGNLITEGEIAFIVGGIEEWDNEYLAHSWWVMADEDTIGQYTGLKDKNGVEIYEGDIVEYKDFSGGLLLFKEQPKSKGVVKINLAKGIYLKGMGTFEGQKVEVIGNVYENPELLKGE